MEIPGLAKEMKRLERHYAQIQAEQMEENKNVDPKSWFKLGSQKKPQDATAGGAGEGRKSSLATQNQPKKAQQ